MRWMLALVLCVVLAVPALADPIERIWTHHGSQAKLNARMKGMTVLCITAKNIRTVNGDCTLLIWRCQDGKDIAVFYHYHLEILGRDEIFALRPRGAKLCFEKCS